MSFPPPSQKQASVLWYSLTALAVAVLVGLTGMICWGMGWMFNRLSAVLLPIAVAVVLAYLLDPVVEFFARKGVPRVRAILLVFFMAAMLALGLLGTVVPGLVAETQRLIQELPQDSRKLGDKIERWVEGSSLDIRLPAIFRGPVESPEPEADAPAPVEPAPAATGTNTVTGPANRTFEQLLELPLSETVLPAMARLSMSAFQWLGAQLGRMGWWAGFVAGLALVPIYVFYFLLEKEGINRYWTNYLPVQESRAKEELIFVLKSINDCLIVFFRGQVLVALCVGALLAIGYSLIGLKYALVLGALAGILGIIPYLGVMISIIPAVTIAIIQFGTWWHPLLVLLVMGLVQAAEGLFISPKIIGDRVGMHPLTVIIAVLIGTTLLGGIIGGVLAIPVTAVLRTLMFRYVWKRQESKAA